MTTKSRWFAAALAVGTALAAASLPADARPGGGPGPAHAGNWHGGGGGWHGGYRGGYRGWHGGGWGWRGYPGYYWPSYYWGVGAGLAAVAWTAPYYSYYGGYYGYPAYGYAAPVTEYVVREPQPGEQVVRSGRPVPQTPPPDPIFYPRNAQTPAQTETDRQDCNRWATTQAGAMSDAQIFQRATFACMDGRGYSVR